jgi:hypothetical protein
MSGEIKLTKNKFALLLVSALLSTVCSLSAHAALAESPSAKEDKEFHCEVLKLKGDVKVVHADGQSNALAEGDLLAVGESVEAAADSYADLAYDREWQNISRIEENSKVKIVQIYPGKLEVKEGSVYAKLKSLPKDSSFEVKTPTAVATVRGTEYRTLFKDGKTDVFNASPSAIYVYGVDEDGAVNKKDLVVLKEAQKTSVEVVGGKPATPQDMSALEQDSVLEINKRIETNISEVTISGRVSQIQSVTELELIKLASDDDSHSSTAVPTEDSRVEDGRRRAFKKTS